MGDNNWLLVKFQVKDPKKYRWCSGVYSILKWRATMKDERKIDCPHCGASLDIDKEEDNIWFDTGDEVLLVPREMLEYIEDSQGLIGIT